MHLDGKYSVIDIETTGGRKDGHKITEIAIVNLDGDKIVDRFSTLINPERSIPLSISYFTGITNEMVANAPKFYEVAKKIVEMTEGRIFVAHNVFFDFNFIKHEFSELGFSFKRDKLCTVRLARKYLSGHKSYSLGNICEDLSIPIKGRHRALGDAEATVKLFLLIKNKVSSDDLVKEKKVKLLLPSNIERNVYECLPNKVGVYYFYNTDGELLYVGKSKDIKKRVAQHFRPDLKRKKDIILKDSISRIEYKLLGNELAALLYEGQEIKSKMPPFNSSLKTIRFKYAVDLIFDDTGVLVPKIFSGVEKRQYLYLFKSRIAAKRKIEKLFESLLGEIPVNETLIQRQEQFIKKVGINIYNELLKKVFYHQVPKQDNFLIETIGPGKQSCHIVVKNKKPNQIVFYDKEEQIEVIPLMDDPQLASIMWNFQMKKKWKVRSLV